MEKVLGWLVVLLSVALISGTLETHPIIWGISAALLLGGATMRELRKSRRLK